MEVSQLTISKETMEQAQRKLTPQEKGDIMLGRLEEIDKSGALAQARTRNDVALYCGYSVANIKAGYAWVKNLIKRGVLEEVLVSKQGRVAEYQYYYKGKQPKKTQVYAPTNITTAIETPVVEASNTLITIYHGDTTVAIENVGREMLADIISTIIK